MTVNRPPQTASFGAAPSKYDQGWQSSFLAQLSRRLGLLAGPYTIQPQIFLQSPNGTVYQVTVDNTGTLSAAVASRGSIHPPV